MRAGAFFSAAAVAAMVCAGDSVGCVTDCTLLACFDSLNIFIMQSEDRPTAAGVYDLTFTTASWETRTLSFEVEGGNESIAVRPFPDDEDHAWLSYLLVAFVKDSHLIISVDSFVCDEEPDPTGYHWVSCEPPREMKLWVRSGGVLLGQEIVEPEYEWYWCRSEECDDRQNYRAEVTILVDDPPEPER